ncbi:MAG TPA: hypothetical protein VH107_02025 [Lacipirellulaceae bacterium]|nr:hypothetical protein [Lacipirellulaceae bacterium]
MHAGRIADSWFRQAAAAHATAAAALVFILSVSSKETVDASPLVHLQRVVDHHAGRRQRLPKLFELPRLRFARGKPLWLVFTMRLQRRLFELWLQ